jgi:NADPH2:quinone reductase
MEAVVLPDFGDVNVLEFRDVPLPEPGPGEIRVRVLASAVNPVEAKIRASGTWAGLPLPAVLGYDAAGLVDLLGPGVTEFEPDDEVYFTPEVMGNPHGTHATYTVVKASIVAKKPKTIGFDEAASIPLAGGTAYEAIVRRLNVKVGDTVLILGGAGGVGSFAVQIAKAAGARVLASAGPSNQDLLKQLGADVAIDYTKRDAVEAALTDTGGVGVDATFDMIGGDVFLSAIPATRSFGRIATILGPRGDLSPLYLKNQTLHGIFLTRERARLEALAKLVDQGRLKPLVAEVRPFNLESVREGHRRLDSGHGLGKFVLDVSSM